MGVIHCPIREGQRPHTDSSRIILTSGLQAGCAYERPNATVAALTCCSLFLFSSHIFCTVCNPPRQQAALYRASACHCSSPPQWPDCPTIVWQDNIDQRKVSKTSGVLRKSWMCCHVRQYPSGCSGSSSVHPWARELKTDADNGPQLSNVHGTLSHCHWLELMWRSLALSHTSLWLCTVFSRENKQLSDEIWIGQVWNNKKSSSRN